MIAFVFTLMAFYILVAVISTGKKGMEMTGVRRFLAGFGIYSIMHDVSFILVSVVTWWVRA